MIPAQIVVPGLAAIVTTGVTRFVTDMVIVLLLAFGPVRHVSLLVITHEIVFPVISALSVYVGLFVPTLLPFFFH